MPGSPERDAPDPAEIGDGRGRTSDALRTAGVVAGADMEARLARQRVASALFGGVGESAATGLGGPRAGQAETRTGRDPAAKPERVGGRYELERTLGAGGMGVVYAAWDPELQRRVAIKLIHEDLERAAVRARLGAAHGDARVDAHADRAAKTQARMLREARALARLSHPNVIHVYDVGTYEGQLFVAMELVEGETLRRWLDVEARDPRRVMEHLVASGRGLEAAHRSGLVHRDFKPENVLIGVDGRVRVVDFGLARLLEPIDTVETSEPVQPSVAAGVETRDGTDEAATDSTAAGSGAASEGGVFPDPRPSVLDPLTLAGVLVGTPRYMAPEQLEGLPADAASDQFAFCVTAWEALTGRPPFVATTVDGLRAAIRASALEAPASSNTHASRSHEVRSWLTLLERGLHHDPDRRWSSMTELLAALSLALAKPKSRRRTSKRTVALAMVLGAGVMAALPLLLGPRLAASLGPSLGFGGPPISNTVTASSARVLQEAASARGTARAAVPDPATSPRAAGANDAVAGTEASPDGAAGGATAIGSASPPPGHSDVATHETGQGSQASQQPGGPAQAPNLDDSASASSKADTANRDVCHLHEDTYELLARGARKRQLEDGGSCFECRLERRRSRTSRFSPADCGAYALCAPADCP